MGIRELMNADVAQVFLDLGETVFLQVINQQFNVETGRMEEFRWTRSLRAISKQETVKQMSGVSATASLLHRQFLALRSEAPPLEELSGGRLIQDEVEYEITNIKESAVNGVLILECRRNDVA